MKTNFKKAFAAAGAATALAGRHTRFPCCSVVLL